MKVLFLGTGTSTGVPQIGCNCEVCTSNDKHDKRLRSSVRIEVDGKVMIIDCTPDFRQQLMGLPFVKINGLLLTHEHYDHVGGIDDLRPFSLFGSVNLYMEEHLENVIRERLPYCFLSQKYGGVPDIRINRINDVDNFDVEGISITPIRVMHYKLPIMGFRIKDFAYLTDVKSIPETEFEKLKGLDTLVISALRKKEHISHQTLTDALQVSKRIDARKTYFSHMSHEMGLHAEIEKELPQNTHFAYDGLEIDVF
ncbi:MAG: MBL fold metallo-hydrolase [Fermentimonas sp.]|nr:MBL fold metallo-hydrolase [Fermentimonas sp.]